MWNMDIERIWKYGLNEICRGLVELSMDINFMQFGLSMLRIYVLEVEENLPGFLEWKWNFGMFSKNVV